MYKIQEKPDESCYGRWKPIVTLKDGHGGVYHIVNDDHCYVLINGAKGIVTSWWFREAVDALKSLPLPE